MGDVTSLWNKQSLLNIVFYFILNFYSISRPINKLMGPFYYFYDCGREHMDNRFINYF